LPEGATTELSEQRPPLDSYAATLAQISNASLLTGDPEFRRLEEDGFLKVSWLSNV
jgi:hypothetical protein